MHTNSKRPKRFKIEIYVPHETDVYTQLVDARRFVLIALFGSLKNLTPFTSTASSNHLKTNMLKVLNCCEIFQWLRHTKAKVN